MKLYLHPGLPNPARIQIALAEKRALDQVQFVDVNILKGEHRLPEFLAKNPFAAVPVLELEDGTAISECTAITEYLDAAFDGPKLTGTTAQERAVIHMMQRRAEANLMDAVGAYFHHATPGLGPELETYQNKEWGEYQKGRAVKGMAYINDVLANQPFVAGNHFSMADITVYAALSFADFAKIEIPAHNRHLLTWRALMAQRPSCAG